MTELGVPSYDVALVITGHHERSLAHHTFKAVRRCIRTAVTADLAVEVVGVLDSADDVTRAIFEEHIGHDGALADSCRTTTLEVSVGDPGLARNAGVAATTADLICVLDADNLPSATGWSKLSDSAASTGTHAWSTPSTS